MKQITTEKFGNRWVLYRPELIPEISEDYFSCLRMQEKDLVIGRADGRGETCFYQSGEKVWALRHYLRGGLIAKFLTDHYFGIRLKNTRAWREWHLLKDMVDMDLPVPVPVAASVIKKGLFYQADLVTEYIESSNTLADVLENDYLDSTIWVDIGQCVRKFHDHSVFHSDLNAKNILLDQNKKVYLIDFDQCGFRTGEGWKAENLSRLKRSLEKFKSRQNQFYFEESNWKDLLAGYD